MYHTNVNVNNSENWCKIYRGTLYLHNFIVNLNCSKIKLILIIYTIFPTLNHILYHFCFFKTYLLDTAVVKGVDEIELLGSESSSAVYNDF